MALSRQSVRERRASAVRPSEKRVFTADVAWGILGGLRLVRVSSRTTVHRYLKRGRLQQMKDPIRTLARGGADGEALADFRCLADATSASGGPRYRNKAHLSWLSAVIAGEHMSAQNRDEPLYALCHLVLMIDAAWPGAEGRWMALLAADQPSLQQFRAWFDENTVDAGWKKPGFAVTPKGVSGTAGDAPWHIYFGRMVSLAALFEFLIGMEAGAHHAEIESTFEALCAGDSGEAEIRGASNALAKILRSYRRRHFSRAVHEERFNTLYRFLSDRSPDGRIVIDDQAIFVFWLESTGDAFVSYAGAAEAMIKLYRLFAASEIGVAIDDAAPFGAERDEWDASEDALGDMPGGPWRSPFEVIDAPPASAIKFFKKEGERKPLANVAAFGPEVEALPLTVLRLDSFGAVQSAISNDLRLSRGTLAARLSCEGAHSYQTLYDTLRGLKPHLEALQKATLWAIYSHGRVDGHSGRDGRTATAAGADNVIAFPGNAAPQLAVPDEDVPSEQHAQILSDAERAFKAMTRKGFDAVSLRDDEHVAGFYVGAGAVLQIADVLERYLRTLTRYQQHLDDMFERDRALFAQRFEILYGEK